MRVRVREFCDYCFSTMLAGDEAVTLDLEELRGKRRSMGNFSGFLAGKVCGLAGGAFWSWGLS